MADELNRNQVRAIDALLASPSVAAAARACGLSERTVWRYLADPEFKAELRRRQDQAIAATSAALAGLSGRAVEALRDLLADSECSQSVKARVALGVLSARREATELDDLSERVAELERRLSSDGE